MGKQKIINGTIEKVFHKTFKETVKIILPTDKEVEQWFDKNIDGDSASSAIYKFRLWLKDRVSS